MSSRKNNVQKSGRRWLPAFWAAPVFADDEKTREARLLHIVSWSFLVALAGAMALMLILLPGTPLRWSVTFIIALISGFSALALNHRGQTRAASLLLLTALWLLASGNALTAGGIRAPGITAYLCIILAAGLLLGERAGIVMGVVCALGGLALVWLEVQGWLPARQVKHTSMTLWCTLVTFIAIVIMLQRLAVRSIQGALNQARSLVSERREVEEALRKSEEKFSKAFRASPNGMAISELETGRYIEVNEGYCRLYGHAREQILGRTSVELGIWEDPRERALLVHGLKTAGVVRDLEVHTRTRTGELRVISLSAEPIEVGGVQCLVSVLHDITDRIQVLEREQKAREEFTQQLISSQEAERQRIAAELHDSLGQNLSVIKNRAQLTRQLPSLPPEAVRHLEAVERVVSEAIAETRSLAHNLRPLHVEQVGLTDSLGVLIREISQSSDIHFERRLENVDDLFAGNAATNVYRIVQEALNNLIKHSKAQAAAVTLERDVRAVRLHVVDDGIGFDTRAARTRGGLGLNNIKERVNMLGGTLTIQSAPGQGTQLMVELPVADSLDGPMKEKS